MNSGCILFLIGVLAACGSHLPVRIEKKSGYIRYIRKHNGKKEEWKIFDREEKLVYNS